MSRHDAARVETVVDRLERHARERPEAPVIVSDERTVTFRELHALAGGCAAWLRAEGVEPGERVGVTIGDDLPHVVALLGLASIGAAHATLATHDREPMRARFAARIGARRVITMHDEYRLPGLGLVALDPDRLAAWARGARRPLPAPDPSSLQTFLTTSGTTGESKIIPLTLAGVARHVERAWVGRVLPMSPIEEAWVERQFLYAILSGNTVVLRAAGDEPLARQCVRRDIDYLVCTGAQANELIANAARDGRLPRRTVLTTSGSRFSIAFRRRALATLCDAIGITYSAQECGSIAHVIERGADEASETVGVPHPGVDVAIVDDAGAPLPPGEPGRIRVRVPGMATGYLDDPHADARHFRDGWFEPGDLASFTPAGALLIHGRADDVMNLAGIKIAPVEIERALERHPAVRAVAAFPLRSPVHGEIPVAAVELADGQRADERELQAFARELLGQRAPRRVMIVAMLPSTIQGKVDTRHLSELMARARPDKPI
jgi:acyl-CoA synthetase (AMP-forming)/AMP-acid ligase II